MKQDYHYLHCPPNSARPSSLVRLTPALRVLLFINSTDLLLLHMMNNNGMFTSVFLSSTSCFPSPLTPPCINFPSLPPSPLAFPPPLFITFCQFPTVITHTLVFLLLALLLYCSLSSYSFLVTSVILLLLFFVIFLLCIIVLFFLVFSSAYTFLCPPSYSYLPLLHFPTCSSTCFPLLPVTVPIPLPFRFLTVLPVCRFTFLPFYLPIPRHRSPR